MYVHVHCIQWNSKDMLGVGHFVYCRVVVRSSEVQNVLRIWENFWVSFVERLFLLCPVFGGSFIGGSTVHVLITPNMVMCYYRL